MEWVPPDQVIADRDPRRAGAFLRSSEQVRARYLRCRGAWASHLESTRRAIERGMQRCVQRRTAIILGGGMLHDVPLACLSDRFERVVIVDVVHLWRSVLAAQRFSNVEQVCVDVSGYISSGQGEPPSVGMPEGLQAFPRADFVVSLNLMSQLAVVPRLEENSRNPNEKMNFLGKKLLMNHLSVLDGLGREITLVTDFERWEVPLSGETRSGVDILYGVNVGPFEETWRWDIAPIPEVSSDYHVFHRVGVRHWTAPTEFSG